MVQPVMYATAMPGACTAVVYCQTDGETGPIPQVMDDVRDCNDLGNHLGTVTCLKSTCLICEPDKRSCNAMPCPSCLPNNARLMT